jgi:excisionase family DNA binding protein
MSTPEGLSPISRLDALESSLLLILQEIRAVKMEIGQHTTSGPSLESLLEAEDVAKLLGVDVGYVYSQAAARKIPSIKLGKYRKFSPLQLNKWLERNRA